MSVKLKEGESLKEAYLRTYVKNGDKHQPGIDTLMRVCIGKTDDISVLLCSHDAIINRELGEKFCRVCHKDLSIVGRGRWNDYLVLRHPQCQQPICLECAENNPDDFHKAFRAGVEEMRHMDPLIRANIILGAPK